MRSVIALFLLLAFGSAHAFTIQLVDDSRRIQDGNVQYYATSGTDFFHQDAHSDAYHDSTWFKPDGGGSNSYSLSGSGASYAETECSSYNGTCSGWGSHSAFELEMIFSTDVTLDISALASFLGGDVPGRFDFRLVNSDDQSQLDYRVNTTVGSTLAINESFDIVGGQEYHLTMTHIYGRSYDQFGTSLTGWEISATASVVPIPATVWLFGSALAGLGWMRRKQTV